MYVCIKISVLLKHQSSTLVHGEVAACDIEVGGMLSMLMAARFCKPEKGLQ